MTKLSIIVPTYNIQYYIPECLNLITDQLTPECELLVVDDCSTDKTALYVRGILDRKHKKTIRTKLWILPENQGVSAARNFALAQAQGEYVAFVDGDDRVAKDYVKTILKAIESKDDYYEMSWRSFGAESKTWYAGNLKASNTSVWCRVFKRDRIKYVFDVTRKTGEDTKFLRENLTEDMTKGLILPVIYEYRRGRPGSLITEYRKAERRAKQIARKDDEKNK